MVKGKAIMNYILEELFIGGEWLNHKQLERDRGFLIYLSRAYRNMCPYLKGVHQTLDPCLSRRDEDGWKKRKRNHLSTTTFHLADNVFTEDDDAPEIVKPAARFKDDVDALTFLLYGLVLKKGYI